MSPKKPDVDPSTEHAHSAFLHGLKYLHDRIRCPALAFDTPYPCAGAAGINILDSLLWAEDLVQRSHWTIVRISGISAAHSLGIGHHGLELLPNHRLGVAEEDGVVI